MNAVSQIRANLLLCDAAQVVGGKLYILGGGWNMVGVQAGNGVSFFVAIDLIIPWELTNRQLNLVVELLSEDREPVHHPDNDQPVRAEGQLVVGRPPDARPGADLHTPLTIPFAPVPVDDGGYVCCLSIDGEQINAAAFQVINLPHNPLAGGPA